MNIILFASPGIMGPYVFFALSQRKDVHLSYLVLPLGAHSVSNDELLAVAQQAQVPYLAPKRLSDPAFLAQVKAADPDLIVVSSYDTKLPVELTAIPTRGAVNLHPSLLPKYRGACPEFWAIRNGDTESGVTLHHLSEEFDGGDIIAQKAIPLDKTETLGTLLYKVSKTSVELISTLIDDCLCGCSLARHPQPHGVATKAPLVGQAELRIDWTEPAQSIACLTRAGNPLGGAWGLFRQYQLKVWFSVVCNDADVMHDEKLSSLTPGTIIVDSVKRRLLVICGEGVLEVTSVQYALFYIMDGWNFSQLANLKNLEVLQ